MVRVYVPTKSSTKLRVVQSAFEEFPWMEGEHFEIRRAFIRGIGEPPLRQPIGWKQISDGARLRASRSYDLHGEGYHIGMQSGLVSYEMADKAVWMDQACIYVLFKSGSDLITGFAATATIEIPDSFAEGVKNGVNELGALVEFHSKREDKDAVAFFSRHYAHREDFLLDGMRSALGSISFREAFKKRPKGPPLALVQK